MGSKMLNEFKMEIAIQALSYRISHSMFNFVCREMCEQICCMFACEGYDFLKENKAALNGQYNVK